MIRISTALAAFGMLAFGGGCSSVLEGTTQDIVVSTKPSGADCDFVRGGHTIARVSPTPGSATVDKTRHDITIQCELEGYRKATYLNKSDYAAASFGNLIAGGIIGVGVDAVSGAQNKYTSPVNIVLTPEAN